MYSCQVKRKLWFYCAAYSTPELEEEEATTRTAKNSPICFLCVSTQEANMQTLSLAVALCLMLLVKRLICFI